MRFSQDNTETKLYISTFPEISVCLIIFRGYKFSRFSPKKFFRGYKFSRIFLKTAKSAKIDTNKVYNDAIHQLDKLNSFPAIAFGYRLFPISHFQHILSELHSLGLVSELHSLGPRGALLINKDRGAQS